LGGPLGTKEIGLLKTLTKDSNPENGIDFEAIAEEISTKLKIQKRHKFQLFKVSFFFFYLFIFLWIRRAIQTISSMETDRKKLKKKFHRNAI
jgi:hypothetical protein